MFKLDMVGGGSYLTTASIKDSMLVTPRCSQGWSVFISRMFFMMKITFSMNWVFNSVTMTCQRHLFTINVQEIEN